MSADVADNAVCDFGDGKITIYIPYVPGENENRDAIGVYYLGDDSMLKLCAVVTMQKKSS